MVLAACGIFKQVNHASDIHAGFVNANGGTLAYERFGSSKHEVVLLIAATGLAYVHVGAAMALFALPLWLYIAVH